MSNKFEVSMAFRYRVNHRYGTDRRTDGRTGATLYAACREGRITMTTELIHDWCYSRYHGCYHCYYVDWCAQCWIARSTYYSYREYDCN